MHLRIYLTLSCLVLAGYVRASEDAAKAPTWAVTPRDDSQSDAPAEPRSPDDQLRASERDLYIDDDGSGLESDESSGSGWGPGPDDEDSRGSGDDAPEDDEDYHPARAFRPASTTSSTTQPPDTTVDTLPPTTVNSIDVEIISRGSETSNQPEGAVPEQPRAPDSRPEQPSDINISAEDINTQIDQDLSGTAVGSESRPVDNVVFIMNAKPEDRTTSFFAQPGILAAVIGGAVVGLLCAILVVMFIVYRMRKKDEGSYALDEPKRSPAAASYGKGHNNREFYA